MLFVRKYFISRLLPTALLTCLLYSCSSPDKQSAPAENTPAKTTETATDYRQYAQYVSCKINGQPYLAYYADHHVTAIVNTLNTSSRFSFSTSADEEKINGETKLSELEFNLYNLAGKGTGIYTSPNDFDMHGHTDFPANGKLKYVRFATVNGQQLTVTAYKDGVVEGTFNVDVADDSNPASVLKITEGVFKIRAGGKTVIKADHNGDVNMDSMLNSAR